MRGARTASRSSVGRAARAIRAGRRLRRSEEGDGRRKYSGTEHRARRREDVDGAGEQQRARVEKAGERDI